MNQTQPTAMVDYVGRRFGKLVASELARDKDGRRAWRCVCDCGGERIVRTGLLGNGNTTSCGCRKNSHRPDAERIATSWPGVYVVVFNTGQVKMGRAGNVGRRLCNYQREALLAGGATYYCVQTQTGPAVERAMLIEAAKISTRVMAEMFTGLAPDAAISIMLKAAARNAPDAVGNIRY